MLWKTDSIDLEGFFQVCMECFAEICREYRFELIGKEVFGNILFTVVLKNRYVALKLSYDWMGRDVGVSVCPVDANGAPPVGWGGSPCCAALHRALQARGTTSAVGYTHLSGRGTVRDRIRAVLCASARAMRAEMADVLTGEFTVPGGS